MKSTKETLGPTRVKLTVEVPFGELKPSLDAAYRKIGRQVRVKGFRPGKVPDRVIDLQVGRAPVLEEAVNDAIPRLYSQALQDNEVQVLSEPEIEVTRFADGEDLAFTAEVDVRPQIELPDYKALAVTVDDAVVTDEDVAAEVDSLRERFASLTTVEQPAADGDYVLVDLVTTVDGEETPGGSVSGYSYRVGSGGLMPGLDEALVGLSAGQSTTFDTEITRGEHAGRTAQVSVTATAVKARQLPEADDAFAELASEFDTIAELTEDVRTRLQRVTRLQQGLAARDKLLEALVTATDVPLPERLVDNELAWRTDNLQRQLDAAGTTLAGWLQTQGKTEQEYADDVRAAATRSLISQFVLDEIAKKEQLAVSEAELTDLIVRRARQQNTSPEDYAKHIVEHNHLPEIMGDAVRGKALALVLEHATVTDTSGATIDLNAIETDVSGAGSA